MLLNLFRYIFLPRNKNSPHDINDYSNEILSEDVINIPLSRVDLEKLMDSPEIKYAKTPLTKYLKIRNECFCLNG